MKKRDTICFLTYVAVIVTLMLILSGCGRQYVRGPNGQADVLQVAEDSTNDTKAITKDGAGNETVVKYRLRRGDFIVGDKGKNVQAGTPALRDKSAAPATGPAADSPKT